MDQSRDRGEIWDLGVDQEAEIGGPVVGRKVEVGDPGVGQEVEIGGPVVDQVEGTLPVLRQPSPLSQWPFPVSNLGPERTPARFARSETPSEGVSEPDGRSASFRALLSPVALQVALSGQQLGTGKPCSAI